MSRRTRGLALASIACKIVFMDSTMTTSGQDERPRASGMTLDLASIVSTPDTCGGKPRIVGTRIQVKHVVIMHERQGMSPEQIVSEHPHLTLSSIHAALAYYHDHREEVDAGIRAEREQYEALKAEWPSLIEAKLKASKADASDDPLPPR